MNGGEEFEGSYSVEKRPSACQIDTGQILDTAPNIEETNSTVLAKDVPCAPPEIANGNTVLKQTFTRNSIHIENGRTNGQKQSSNDGKIVFTSTLKVTPSPLADCSGYVTLGF